MYDGKTVSVAAYNKNGVLLKGDIDDLEAQYKLLPAFMVILAHANETDPDFRQRVDDFTENAVVDNFVNLHEDFYQNHKNEEYELA